MSPNPPLDRAFPADPASTSVLFPLAFSRARIAMSRADRRSNRLKLRVLDACNPQPATMHNKILSFSVSLSLFSVPKVARLAHRMSRGGRKANSAGGRCATTTISERDPPRKNSGGYDYVSSAETDRAECLQARCISVPTIRHVASGAQRECRLLKINPVARNTTGRSSAGGWGSSGGRSAAYV